MANELEKNTETNQEPDKKDPEKKEDGGTTIEELQERLKKLETENGKLRQANTNASAEASQYKKKYNELLPEKERLENQQKEQETALREELEKLKAERNVANYKSQLTAPDIGVEASLAQEMAEAMNSGDTAKVFEGLRKFIVAHDKSLKENAFRNNQTLQGGTSGKAVSKEEFEKMGYMERLEVFNKHPDLYEEYTK